MAPSDFEYIIQFDPGKCTQCHGCEIACKTWRGLEYGLQYRRVLNLWQGGYPQAASSTISLSCLHCVEPQCVAVCPEEAITKEAEDGLVVVDPELCVGCRLCLEACSFDVPQFGTDDVMEKCDLCRPVAGIGATPPCVDTCPGQALIFCKLTPQEKRVHEQAAENVLKGSWPRPG